MSVIPAVALWFLSAHPTPGATAAHSPRCLSAFQTAAGANTVDDMHEAAGTFEVKAAPYPHSVDPAIPAFSLEKTYAGAIKGTARGEMLTGGNRNTGNAGYVALEVVTGTLDGKSGSFALMQSGTMTNRSPPQLNVQIVPGSGTGELSGLYGTMTIHIAPDGSHSYTLRYAFSAK